MNFVVVVVLSHYCNLFVVPGRIFGLNQMSCESFWNAFKRKTLYCSSYSYLFNNTLSVNNVFVFSFISTVFFPHVHSVAKCLWTPEHSCVFVEHPNPGVESALLL